MWVIFSVCVSLRVCVVYIIYMCVCVSQYIHTLTYEYTFVWMHIQTTHIPTCMRVCVHENLYARVMFTNVHIFMSHIQLLIGSHIGKYWFKCACCIGSSVYVVCIGHVCMQYVLGHVCMLYVFGHVCMLYVLDDVCMLYILGHMCMLYVFGRVCMQYVLDHVYIQVSCMVHNVNESHVAAQLQLFVAMLRHSCNCSWPQAQVETECVCVCMYVCMYVCMRAYIYVYICIHTYIRIYIYIYVLVYT